MNETDIFPKKWKFLSGSMLKLIAVITMLIDHTASVFLRDSDLVLFSIGSRAFPLYTVLRYIGRSAFPLYAFLLVEGYLHTHDKKKYGRNLLLFAIISELPWNLEHTGTLLFAYQNVFFTLFIGFLGIALFEYFQDYRKEQVMSLLLLLLLSYFLHADYGMSGFCFILFLYALRKNRLLQTVIGCGFLSSGWGAGLAFIPINLYNGKRGFIHGKFLKYLFYAIYPVHLLVLYVLRYIL